MNLLKKIILGVSFLGLVLSVAPVNAQGIKDQNMLSSIAGKAGVADKGSVEGISATVIKAILSITGLIFLILMVYAGMLWMTARGDEGQIDKSKEIIQAAIIGLAVTVSAYAITVFVTSRFASTETALFCKVTSVSGDGTENTKCVPVPASTEDCAVYALDNGYIKGIGTYTDPGVCAE